MLLLTLSYLIAFILFAEKSYAPLQDTLVSLGYFGSCLAGFLYAYAFTAAPATAILLILAEEQNLLLAGLTAGFGALLGDLGFFRLIRHGFNGEIQRLSQERIVKTAQRIMSNSVQRYLLIFLACFLIASPLPTEIGITLLASVKNLTPRRFSIIAYILHTTAIFVILLVGSTI